MKVVGTEREFHRRSARSCFNSAWDYLDKKNRTPEENRQMLNLAHASRYHWGLVGTDLNLAVGDWQLSRVYAALGHSDLALQFAQSCLSTCEANRLDGAIHFAYEGVARAYAVGLDAERAVKYLGLSRAALSKQKLGREGRRIYAGQLMETERLIREIRRPHAGKSRD